MVYLELFHGRKTPTEHMEDWGKEGPIFGPFPHVHTTYALELKFAEGDVLSITQPEGLVYYDGMYYGDWSVFSAHILESDDNLKRRVAAFDPEKARPPATTASVFPGTQEKVPDVSGPPHAVRHRLPAERQSITHRYSVGGHEGYLTVGFYPNGQPGEIFLRMAKEGSTMAGLMECFGTAVSVGLQHGVPLKVLCEKFAHTRFEPSGWTGSQELGYATSIMDYIFRWMETRFPAEPQLSLFQARAMTPDHGRGYSDVHASLEPPSSATLARQGDAPACSTCGSLMRRNGSCFACSECGRTTGCS